MITILKNERVRLGLTQRKFGAALGIPQSWISYYENREQSVGINRAARISSLLRMHREKLFDANGWAIILPGSEDGI
jgi:transcriptional regulator with XRE-family HTH domain